jgi:hypothetical protein
MLIKKQNAENTQGLRASFVCYIVTMEVAFGNNLNAAFRLGNCTNKRQFGGMEISRDLEDNS